MDAPAPTYPVFLVLPQVADRISTLLPALEPVRSTVGPLAVHAVDVYYRTATDTALLAFRFDPEQITTDLLGELTDSASRIGAALIEPIRLPEAGRRRFFASTGLGNRENHTKVHHHRHGSIHPALWRSASGQHDDRL